VTYKNGGIRGGITGVFLDPPYAMNRCSELYAHDDMSISSAVRAWAVEMGKRTDMRIALCGYAGEHDLPGWEEFVWKANGGFGSQGQGQARVNARSERIWFSPACLGGRQGRLF
jgi:hypothetical protein